MSSFILLTAQHNSHPGNVTKYEPKDDATGRHVIFLHVSVRQVLKVVASNTLVSVGRQNGPPIAQAPQALHPDPLPGVEQVPVQVLRDRWNTSASPPPDLPPPVWAGPTDTHTLVELASLTASDEAFSVWVPGHAGQTVLMRLTHFCPQLSRLSKGTRNTP